jgi:hypothetical protein
VLRHQDILVNAQLTWEDGRIFLTDAIAKPWYATWFSPFIGYFIVLPKVVASLFTPLTLVHAPLVFNAFSLAVMAFAIALPLCPSFSRLAPLRYRAIWVAASALMPWHTETFGNITNIHWYIYYALTLFSLADLTASSRWTRVLLPPCLVLGIFTTPNAVAIVPVLLVRLWFERHTRSYQAVSISDRRVHRAHGGKGAALCSSGPPGGPVDLLGIAVPIKDWLQGCDSEPAGGLASILRTASGIAGAGCSWWLSRGGVDGAPVGQQAEAGPIVRGHPLLRLRVDAARCPRGPGRRHFVTTGWGADR